MALEEFRREQHLKETGQLEDVEDNLEDIYDWRPEDGLQTKEERWLATKLRRKKARREARDRLPEGFFTASPKDGPSDPPPPKRSGF